MHIVKLDATDSTNAYLKNLARQNELDDFTTVVTFEQSIGRGQLGSYWESEPGKNLTFSTLKKFNILSVTEGYLLNVCVSLAVLNALNRFSIPDVHVKWPNDILSGTKKICGILVENILFGNQIKTSIIGIGLNINQTIFHTVSNATSMKLLLGDTFNLDEVRNTIIEELKNLFSMLEKREIFSLRNTYEQELFRKDKPATFENIDGSRFVGIIRGISPEGRLFVELEDAIITAFDLKEIKLLY